MREPGPDPAKADFAAAVELGEAYVELLEGWTELFDGIFALASRPEIGLSEEALAVLEAALHSYAEGIGDLPTTPITERLVESETSAVNALIEAYELTAELSEEPDGGDPVSSAIRVLVESGRAHQEGRAEVARYVQSMGLDLGL